MRTKSTPLFKSLAFLAVLSFLLGVGSVGAADREEKLISKEHKSPRVLNTGKHQNGLEYFLKSLAGSECSSSCCWAVADCEGGNTDCNSSRCVATCPDGSRSQTSCDAT